MVPVGVAAGMGIMASIVSGKIMGAGVEVEVGASIASGMIDCEKVFSAREGRLASTRWYANQIMCDVSKMALLSHSPPN
jgi:hypothetical protein